MTRFVDLEHIGEVFETTLEQDVGFIRGRLIELVASTYRFEALEGSFGTVMTTGTLNGGVHAKLSTVDIVFL